MSRFVSRAPLGRELDLGEANHNATQQEHRQLDDVARFRQRRLLLGGGVSVTAAFFLPERAHAQFDVAPINLRFGDQARAAASMSAFLQWHTLFDLAESYSRTHEMALADDRQALSGASSYLLRTLRPRLDDVKWFVELTGEQANAFQNALLATLRQSEIRDDRKSELFDVFSQEELYKRYAQAADEAPALADGIEIALRQSSQETGIPRIADEKLRQRWLCMVLRSILSGALASSRWQMVAAVALELRSNGCWSRG